MAGHGGKRIGAGRPTDAAIEQKKGAGAAAIARFTERALKDLDELYDAQKALALGVWYEGCSRCEKPKKECHCRERRGEAPLTIKVYKQLPHQKAGETLLSHTKGRAAVAQQVQQETTIILRLGCDKCGTAIPRPPKKKEKADDGATISEADGAGAGVAGSGERDPGSGGGPGEATAAVDGD